MGGCMGWEWAAFGIGVLASLADGARRHVRADRAKSPGMGLWDCLRDWFFERSASNAASWATSVGGVLLVGCAAVHQLRPGAALGEMFGPWGAFPAMLIVGAASDKMASALVEAVVGRLSGAGVAVLVAALCLPAAAFPAGGQTYLAWDASPSCFDDGACDYRVYARDIGAAEYPPLPAGATTGTEYPIDDSRRCYVVTAVAVADPDTESPPSNEVCHGGYAPGPGGRLLAPALRIVRRPTP